MPYRFRLVVFLLWLLLGSVIHTEESLMHSQNQHQHLRYFYDLSSKHNVAIASAHVKEPKKDGCYHIITIKVIGSYEQVVAFFEEIFSQKKYFIESNFNVKKGKKSELVFLASLVIVPSC